MRPLELTVEGFASFREPQTIDFTALDDLFVITGPTGSGKTTLLDAVTLSLFEEVPRATKHERKEFISIGAAKMKVQFDFRADGNHYRITRIFPREGSQDAGLEQVVDGHATPVMPDANISDINEEIVRIVGLDVDAFTKAVLLPQGEFHKFLKGRPKERKETGIRLLDLERFRRAGQIARQRARRFSEEADQREELIEEEYAEATSERVDDLREAYETAKKRRKRLEEVQEEVDETLDEVEAIDRRTDRLDRIWRVFETVASKLDALDERWLDLEPQTEAIAEQLEQTAEALESAEEVYGEATEALKEVREDTGGDERLTRLEEAHRAREKATDDIEGLEKKLESAGENRSEIKEKLRAIGDQMEEAEGVEKAADEAVDEAREARDEAAKALEKARDREEAEQELEEAGEAVEKANRSVEKAEERRDRAAKQLEEAREHRDDVHREYHASALRQQLEPGDPCPVCEHDIEEVPPVSEEGDAALEEADRAVEEAEEELEHRRTALLKAREKQVQANSRQERAEERLEDLPTVELEAARQAHEEAEKTFRQRRQDRQEAEKQRKQAAKKHAQAQADRTGVAERIERLGEQLESARERRDEADSTIEAAIPETPPEGLPAYIEEARQRLQTARKQHDGAQEAREQARKARQKAERRERSYREALSSLDQDIRGVRTRVESAAEIMSSLPGLDEVPAAPGWDGDTSHATRLERLDGWRGRLADRAARHAAELEERQEDSLGQVLTALKEADLEVSDRTPAAIQKALRTSIGNAREQETEVRGDVESTEQAIKKRMELEEKVADLRDRAARHQRIARELRTDRFIQFLLEESFQELALRASEELRDITDGRYSLVAGGYDFRIVDHANADEERSVVTLSGGETFLASLSLALALAGGIRDIAGIPIGSRLEAIFIDEGFGTLDPDVLDLVIDALEEIQQDERQVGVITHVQTVAERIPGGLQVEPGVSGEGSTVIVR